MFAALALVLGRGRHVRVRAALAGGAAAAVAVAASRAARRALGHRRGGGARRGLGSFALVSVAFGGRWLHFAAGRLNPWCTRRRPRCAPTRRPPTRRRREERDMTIHRPGPRATSTDPPPVRLRQVLAPGFAAFLARVVAMVLVFGAIGRADARPRRHRARARGPLVGTSLRRRAHPDVDPLTGWGTLLARRPDTGGSGVGGDRGVHGVVHPSVARADARDGVGGRREALVLPH